MLLVRGKSFHFLKNLIYILFDLFNISLFLMSYSKCQEIRGPVEAFALDLKHEKQPESQKNPSQIIQLMHQFICSNLNIPQSCY